MLLLIVTSEQPEGSVAALTTLPRSEWAKIRKEHFSDGLNLLAREAIEEALFVVSLLIFLCDVVK